MEEKEVRKYFEERTLRGTERKRVNEGIWEIFKKLYNASDKFEGCYLMAEEINALTAAIMSLDNHICGLIGRINQLNKKINELDKKKVELKYAHEIDKN